MMERNGVGLVCAVALWIVSGCAASEPNEPAKTELVVSAAASLTDAMKELAAKYESAVPGVDVQLNFGSSGALQRQIGQGAPVDVFISAGSAQMDALVEQEWIMPGSRIDLLTNEMVVIVPKDSASPPSTVEDLQRERFLHIAVGQPDTVPAGGYAREALNFYGLWDRLLPQIVFGKDVRQVLSYVETGNADAGWVYRTDALASDHVSIAFAVDPQSHARIAYLAGVATNTAHPDEAMLFFNFLQQETAAQVFESYGFKAGPP